MSIPPLFRCPISLDLFIDPVTLCTGQTYDRSSIEKWIANGNHTCPVTMQTLDDFSLVPNHTLQCLIGQWLLMDTQSDIKPVKDIELSFCFAKLKQILQSPDTILATKIKTMRKIATLSEESDSVKCCLIKFDFYPLLVELLFPDRQDNCDIFSEDLMFAQEILKCISNLWSSTKAESLNVFKDPSISRSMAILFHHGNLEIKKSLCNLVEKISCSSDTRESCYVIGQNQEILHDMISILQCKHNESLLNSVVGAISGLSSIEMNRLNIIRAGGIDGLLTFMSNTSSQNSSKALSTLEILFSLESGKRDLLDNKNAVNLIVNKVFRVHDDECNESAVCLLFHMCCHSLKTREEAINAGVLRQILLLLQSQCSSRAKNKARMLLKLLR